MGLFFSTLFESNINPNKKNKNVKKYLNNKKQTVLYVPPSTVSVASTITSQSKKNASLSSVS